MSPEEIIKIFNLIWELPEHKAKMALFGLVLKNNFGMSIKSLDEILSQKGRQGAKDS